MKRELVLVDKERLREFESEFCSFLAEHAVRPQDPDDCEGCSWCDVAEKCEFESEYQKFKALNPKPAGPLIEAAKRTVSATDYPMSNYDNGFWRVSDGAIDEMKKALRDIGEAE